MAPSLIRECRIQWCCSLFLPVSGETWYLDKFKYAEFNGDVHFFPFRQEIPFLGKFDPKNRIVSLRWNLILRLIRICRIQWSCSLFSFSTKNTLFGQIWSKKIKIISLRWNLMPRLIWIWRIQWCCSLFFVFNWKYPFGANLVQNVKVISLSWNLVPRLIRISRTQS